MTESGVNASDGLSIRVRLIRDGRRPLAMIFLQPRHLASLEQTVEERTHSLRLARYEAETANAAKSNFLATMSHEIRPPMNGMMVMAEMLTSADLSPRHRRYADIISRSGKSLLTIINDILDLSKIESGKMDLEILPVSLDSLVADVASLFWERAREKGLQLATYVSPSVPVSILGDPTRLNQIVTNLVNNALKFTESGGVTIRVDARPCPVKGSVSISIDVEDSGIGIPEDKIGTVFEAFSQADQSTTRKYGGTGLGLSICSRLADAMGGTIAVESEPGRGSVFRLKVALPVDQAAPALAWVGLSAMVNIRAGQVQDALERSLRDFGCTIVSADADFMIGTSTTLQADTTPGGVPCIVLSDIGDTMADALLRDGAAVDALANPVSRAELLDLLARVASGDYLGTAVHDSRTTHAGTPSFEGKSILAVDDNPVNREVLRETLGALRIAVTFAENGQEAVEKAAAGAFDIILMDGSMPVMGGIEATQLIRAHEARTQSPRSRLLALTAQVSGDDASTWRSAGADGYLTKPFTMERLIAALSDADSPEAAVQVGLPGPADATGELLAMDTLASMDALGSQSGRNVRQRIWTMFHAEAPRACTGLAALINSGAANPEIVRQAHALKSMALSAGAKQVALICQSLERDAGNGLRQDGLAETVVSLASALEATYDAMGFHADGEEPARSAS
jgi:two-component system, NarL family, sensor histidine kinase BarA